MSLSDRTLPHACIVRLEGGDASSPSVIVLLSRLLCDSDTPCGSCSHCDKASRGIHPDVTVIKKPSDKKEISVEQVREAVFSARLLPNEAERRVIVIDGAENMNTNAQNALLKLLEEPPAHIALLLITPEPGALLATVRSRCRVIEAGGETETVPEGISKLASRYIECALSGGLALAELSFELEKTDKNDFSLFLAEVRRISMKLLRSELEACVRKNTARLREVIEVSKKVELFISRNVSVLHVSALLCNLEDESLISLD